MMSSRTTGGSEKRFAATLLLARGDEMFDDRSVGGARLRRRMTAHLLARAVSIGVLGIALLDPGSARAQSTSDP